MAPFFADLYYSVVDEHVSICLYLPDLGSTAPAQSRDNFLEFRIQLGAQ